MIPSNTILRSATICNATTCRSICNSLMLAHIYSYRICDGISWWFIIKEKVHDVVNNCT